MKHGTAIIVLLGAGAIATGCQLFTQTSDLEIADPAVDGAAGSAGTAGSDAGSDANPDAEIDAAPPPCDPNEAPGDGVYVSPTSGDDAGGDGSPAQPLATIAAAISAANAAGKSRVILDQGTYVEAVSVPELIAGLFIEGGWAATGTVWQRDCSAEAPDKTVISGPANAVAAVHVVNVQKTSGLRRLTVRAASPGTAAAGQSGRTTIGIWVDASVWSLEDVRVIASRGGDGGIASAGMSGTTSSCTGISDCASGEDAPFPGPDGATNPGSWSATGFVPGDGTNGGAGTEGKNGVPSAQGPQSATCPQGCTASGSCGCNADPAVFVSAAPGRCGCGGTPGGGGGGGRGGGASIALLATGASATVDVVRSVLTASDGGDGSPGAAGGTGGPGSAGTPGGNASCVTGCGNGGVCGNCGTTSQSTLSGGAAGGAGGDGSDGGPGGPGAGGPSITVVRGNGAKVLSAATTFVFGNGGQGAQSAGKTAPNGAAQELLVYP